MKSIFKKNTYTFLASVLLILTSCVEKRNNENPSNVVDTPVSTTRDHTYVSPDTFKSEERTIYVEKINRRITELESERDSLIEARDKEKNEAKRKQFDKQIEKYEASRRTLKERLDTMEYRIEKGWKEFKAEIDSLMDNV